MLNIIINSFIKMFIAVVCGSLLGMTRTLSLKQAGIKTHALLALATCSLTLVSNLILAEQTPRVIAGIIQGIGFLGAGVIYLSRDQHTIRGLTSSVILWLAAIVGIICATDYWYIGLCAIVLFFFVMFAIKPIEAKLKEIGLKNNQQFDKEDDD